MFFNELSLVPAADIPAGQQRVARFVATIRAATTRGVQRALHLPENFFGVPIAPGYYWKNWLNDNHIDLEVRRFFRSLATKVPFLRNMPDAEAYWRDIDCLWQNQLSLGLKAAYVADGLAVSIFCQPEWDTSWLECEIRELVDGDIDNQLEMIHHAASVDDLDPHMSWIQNGIRNAVGTGRDLWLRINDFFPLLTICEEVERQMADLPTDALPSIARGLFHLNAYCIGWQLGGFDPGQIQCIISPDSRTTLDRYGAERTFLCPDGERRVFTWHAKLGFWRIYFDPAPGPGRLVIGYVGQHLRTVRFN